ncbi:glycosyl hydrolase 115 family protein [Secundilactobacillus mixtipabuli]|uniref:Glycosyl hydrolase family 115 n=1 Tax=Secundilactobacillus mixtipabuli TaxID=1435342 RepID=A0A1Z5IEW2_9LACO|nr:glycosyl hydrolase 115 family protein [Secundilactobacillus mixtipabuli]GAX00273.1 hypothetical protein IWT30_02255 [Secundilactobacillus mixtipabuli]
MTKQAFTISHSTHVVADDLTNPVLKNAQMILQRDIDRVTTKDDVENQILLRLDSKGSLSGDQYHINYDNDRQVTITASTALGVLYGAVAVSREILKIDDFWYWLDTPIAIHEVINWTRFALSLPDYKVPYRGWFVNDELLIMGWEDHDSNTYVWQRIFETAVRAGCNVIVPGTDINSRLNRLPAQAFGLMIAQHHAEPLGAEMFAREYPNLTASFVKYPELFRNLWQKAIMEQKGTSTIYSLGFRGQGDKPFWLDDDSRVWTEQAKADVINQIIKEQYEMVQQLDPGAPTAINIYGEVTAMYNSGLLKLPSDVIEIWADSGYGKMVSRRQFQDNPRSPVFSVPNPQQHKRGIYYHIAFHDLQASNFLGLLSNRPSFVSAELAKVSDHHMDTLELINTGSIKPHILYLREVSKAWLKDYQPRTDHEIVSEYVNTYYSEQHVNLTELYLKYWDAIVQYGPHTDETAGDELAPYLIRRIVKAWVGHANQLPDTNWLVGDVDMDEALIKVDAMIQPKLADWQQLLLKVRQTMLTLDSADARMLYGDFYISVVNQAQGLTALAAVIQAYQTAQKATSPDDYLKPFLLVDDAYRTLANIVFVEEHHLSEKWRDFYKNDGYNNVPLSVEKLKFLRQYLRTLGDSDDEDDWERRFIKTPSEARVMTLWTTRRELSDDKLADKLREILILKQ